MNIKQYIESGILEEFVLGLLSQQDQEEVRRLAAVHPEIQKEIFSIEDTLEKYAEAHAQAPPQGLRQRVLAQFETETQVKPLKEQSLWPKLALVASLIVGLGFVFGLYQLQKLNTRNSNLDQKVEQLSKEVTQKAALLSLYQNQGMLPVKLSGVKNQDCSAQIFWDKSSKEVVLHASNLPRPNASQQYQLWRISDGKPVDMGVIADTYFDNIIYFKAVDKATAFAITLEKKGGSKTPTLEAMVVMGGV